jgi:hypothetical protein
MQLDAKRSTGRDPSPKSQLFALQVWSREAAARANEKRSKTWANKADWDTGTRGGGSSGTVDGRLSRLAVQERATECWRED